MTTASGSFRRTQRSSTTRPTRSGRSTAGMSGWLPSTTTMEAALRTMRDRLKHGMTKLFGCSNNPFYVGLASCYLLAGSIAGQSPHLKAPGITREALYEKLLKAHVPDPDRVLVHYSHTCDLVIGGGVFPVVDVREL